MTSQRTIIIWGKMVNYMRMKYHVTEMVKFQMLLEAWIQEPYLRFQPS